MASDKVQRTIYTCTSCARIDRISFSANQQMDAFPFTNTEWDRVKDATFPLLNARLADDDVLADSLYLDLQDTLKELRDKYGDHPVLLETDADFCDDIDESLELYADALDIAVAENHPISSICLSYARVLIDNGWDVMSARALLETCRERVYADADKTDIAAHEELTALTNCISRKR